MIKISQKTLNKPFIIASICRGDLLALGYNEKTISSLDDGDMISIASKISSWSQFVIDLRVIVDDIIKKKTIK
jgi:hypothetical protein